MINYTDYKIIRSEELNFFEEYVNEALEQGWVPIGQVFNMGCKICREMVKVEEVTPDSQKTIDTIRSRERIHGRGTSARGG